MGLVSRLVKNYSQADFDREIRSVFRGRKTLSGVSVSEDSALRFITVYSCVKILAETMGALPFRVYRKRRVGRGADEAWDHPVYRLLHDSPNDEMPSLTWREAMMGHLGLAGKAFSIITTNRRGQAIDLYPADWHQMDVDRDPDTRRLRYWLDDRGKREYFPPERVFHIPAFSPDGIQGYSPIRLADEAVGLGLASTEFAARFYGQGMNMGIVLEHPGELGKEGRDNLKADLMEQGGGLQNSWLPLILEEGMKVDRIPMPLRDAQFIEREKLTRDDLCGLYRVPPHMVANLDRATFSNIEHLSIEFVMFTMLPWVKRWEQVANWKLFTAEERAQGYYAAFNLNGLMRGDYKSRQEGLAIQRQNGVINADDWRDMEEMNPIGGPAGQAYLVNGNMVGTETAANQPPRQPGGGGGQTGQE